MFTTAERGISQVKKGTKMSEEDFRLRVTEFMGRVDERLKRLEGTRGWLMTVIGGAISGAIVGVLLTWLR